MKTEKVYDEIMEKPVVSNMGRIKKALSLGMIAGLASAILVILEIFSLFVWETLCPSHTIDIAVNFDSRKYIDNDKEYGDHMFSVKEHKTNRPPFDFQKYQAFISPEGKRKISIDLTPATA